MLAIPSKRSLIPVITLFFCLFLHGSGHAQTKAERVSKRLEVIENELYNDPTTTKSELLGILKEKSGIPDTTLGEVYLWLATTLGMTNQLDSGVWATQEAMRLLPDQSILKATSMRLQAILYRLKGDWKKAEESIRLSLQLNDSLWKNPVLKAITLQENASLYLDRKEYFKATSVYLEALKAIQSADKNGPKTPYTVVKLRINLAEAFLMSKNYPFAIREFLTALPQLDSLKDNDGYVRAGLQMVDALVRINQPKQADSLLNLLRSRVERMNNSELQAYIFHHGGVVQSAMGNVAEALSSFRSAFALLEKNSSPMLPICAIGLLKELSKTGDGETEAKKVTQSRTLKTMAESAPLEDKFELKRAALRFVRKDLSNDEFYTYTEELLRMEDSLTAEKERQSAAQIQAQYQFERQQEAEEFLTRENKVLKQERAYKRNQFYLTTVIALLSLTVLGMLLFRIRQKSREKDRMLQAKEQELNYQRDRRQWTEKERDLRDQLILQQKAELMRSLENYAELKSQLEQLVMEQQQEQRKELLVQIEKSKQEKQGIEHLISQFNAVYPTFGTSLMRLYPDLSASDVQFCVLCRMNLTTKEISILFNIEYKSVYARKYRIVEKMGLSETEEFDRVLFGLE